MRRSIRTGKLRQVRARKQVGSGAPARFVLENDGVGTTVPTPTSFFLQQPSRQRPRSRQGKYSASDGIERQPRSKFDSPLVRRWSCRACCTAGRCRRSRRNPWGIPHWLCRSGLDRWKRRSGCRRHREHRCYRQDNQWRCPGYMSLTRAVLRRRRSGC